MKCLTPIIFLCSFLNLYSQLSWTSLNGPKKLNATKIAFRSMSEYCLNESNLGILRTTDGGVTWTNIFPKNSDFVLITDLAMTLDGAVHVIAEPSNIFTPISYYVLDPGSSTWRRTNAKLTRNDKIATNSLGWVYLWDNTNLLYTKNNGQNIFGFNSAAYTDYNTQFIFYDDEHNFMYKYNLGNYKLYSFKGDGKELTEIFSPSFSATLYNCFHPDGYLFFGGNGLSRYDVNSNQLVDLRVSYNFKSMKLIDGNRILAIDFIGDYYLSNDAGGSWTLVRSAGDSEPILYHASNDSIIDFQMNSCKFQLRQSSANNEWKAIIPNFGSSNAMLVAAMGSSQLILLDCNLGSVIRTSDLGKTWVEQNRISYLSPNFQTFLKTNVVTSAYTGIQASFDNGNHWDKLARSPNFKNIISLVTDQDSVIVLVENNQYFYTSVDAGKTWSSCYVNSGSNAITNATSVKKAKNGDLFLIVDGIFYYSSNKGIYWNVINIMNKTVTAFEMVNDGTFLISAEGGIFDKGTYITNDRGKTISKRADRVFSTIKKIGKYFVGYDDSYVEVSLDTGRTWQRLDAGLPQFSRYFNVLWNDDGYLFVHVVGEGVYRTKKSLLEDVANHDFENESVHIYPIPSSGEITILLNEKYIGHDFEIIDMNGQRITTAKIDSKEIKISSDHFLSQIYFFKISNSSISKKFIVQKN